MYNFNVEGNKDNAIITYSHDSHKYLINICYGKIMAYKDEKPMKRLGKVVQYMLDRFYSLY
jgi:hypothetical protein